MTVDKLRADRAQRLRETLAALNRLRARRGAAELPADFFAITERSWDSGYVAGFDAGYAAAIADAAVERRATSKRTSSRRWESDLATGLASSSDEPSAA